VNPVFEKKISVFEKKSSVVVMRWCNAVPGGTWFDERVQGDVRVQDLT